MDRRRRSRWYALVVLVVLAIGLWAPNAGAHSVLESSTPASGETVASAPSEVTLTFNEPVSLPPGAVRLLDVEGDEVDIPGPKAVDAVVTNALPDDLADGSYVLAWKVMSADSHPVSGAFTFAIGAPSQSSDGTDALAEAQKSESPSTGARVLADLATGLGYAGALLAVGVAVFMAFVDQPGPVGRAQRRLIAVGAAVGAFGLVLSIFAETILIDAGNAGASTGTALGDQLTGSIGLQALIGVIGLAVLVVSSRVVVDPAVRRSIVVAGAAVTLGAFVIVGHTRTASPIGLTIATDLVHLVVAAVWTGGLAALLVALWPNPVVAADGGPVDEDTDDVAVSRAVLVARFSAVATVSIIAVLIAGSIMGWRIVGSWRALTHTTYGVLLLVKVGLFAVVAGIGAFNKFRLVGLVTGDGATAARRRLRTMLAVELAVIACIIGVTAALTSTSPNETVDVSDLTTTPITCEEAAAMEGMPGMETMDHAACTGTTTSGVPFDPTANAGSSGGAIVQSAAFGDGLALVTVSPGKVGSNTVSISLTDADGASVDPKDPPTVEFRLREKNLGPITQTSERVGPGAYRVTQDFVLAGEWEINVSAVVSDFDQPQAIVKIPVQG